MCEWWINTHCSYPGCCWIHQTIHAEASSSTVCSCGLFMKFLCLCRIPPLHTQSPHLLNNVSSPNNQMLAIRALCDIKMCLFSQCSNISTWYPSHPLHLPYPVASLGSVHYSSWMKNDFKERAGARLPAGTEHIYSTHSPSDFLQCFTKLVSSDVHSLATSTVGQNAFCLQNYLNSLRYRFKYWFWSMSSLNCCRFVGCTWISSSPLLGWALLTVKAFASQWTHW